MLTDARGEKLFVGDLVGTVTGGQNAMVLVGTVKALHDVKITVDITEASFVGEPISEYAIRQLPKIGATRQLNAYRVFRLGPCPCARREQDLERAWNE